MKLFKSITNIFNTSHELGIYVPPYPDTRTEKQKEAFRKEMNRRNKEHGLLPR